MESGREEEDSAIPAGRSLRAPRASPRSGPRAAGEGARERVTRPRRPAPSSRARASAARSWPGPRQASRAEGSRAETWGRRRGPRRGRLAAWPRCRRTPTAIVFAPGWRGRCPRRRSAPLPGARRSAAGRAGGGARSRTPSPRGP